MKKNLSKILSLALAAIMVLGVLAGCAPTAEKPSPSPTQTVQPSQEPSPSPEPSKDPNELPRNETLYIGGLQWSRIVGWNPLSGDMNNAMGVTQNAASRCPVYETPYMYNPLTGKQIPLLADGDYAWNAARTEMTFKMNADAKWSDGTPVTADDVAYTYATHLKYETTNGNAYKEYIDRIEAKDASTVVIYAKLDAKGKAANPLMVDDYIGNVYVLQKAYLQKVEARNNNEKDKVVGDPCEDFVHSGPYTKFMNNDQKVVFIRDDNYWGQAKSMWGKLPVPKYIAHGIYADNAAAIVGLTEGQIDVAQLFISDVQKLWLEKKLPISTYIDEPPYGICENLPTAFFNLNKPELQNVAIRKAIAIATDYDTIIATAMTNQSPTFKQIPRSMMNPTPGEQATFDHDAIKDLQWAGNDIEGAKKLLDDAGIKDKDGDGFRELNGKKLSFNACAPYGWSDWQAAMEIVAAAGNKIGIEITTNSPDWSVYQTVATKAKQDEYDIFMFWTSSASMIQPWGRCRWLMSSEFVNKDGNWNGNFGQYTNKRVDELLKLIPQEGDAAKLKAYYTELNKIYLTDVPSFGLMYRPNQFYTVNESVWTNFPSQDDGRQIPPLNLLDGYSIAGLYGMELAK